MINIKIKTVDVSRKLRDDSRSRELRGADGARCCRAGADDDVLQERACGDLRVGVAAELVEFETDGRAGPRERERERERKPGPPASSWRLTCFSNALLSSEPCGQYLMF